MPHLRARARLRRRLTALLVLPLLAALTALGAVVISTQNALLLQSADRALAGHLLTLRAIAGTLRAGSHDGELERVLQRIDASEAVNGIVVYDRQGRSIGQSHVGDRSVIDAAALPVIATGRTFHELVRTDGREELLRIERVDEADLGAIAIYYDLGFERAAAKREVLLVVLAVGLATLGLALAAAWIARVLGAKLGGLVHAAERVAAGELDVRIDESPLLEIEQVSRSFNVMTAALADARRRIEEGDEAHRELERRVRHSEALAIVGQVASSFAHEIGSPLSTILGWARLGSQDESIGAEAREQFETIAAQCDRIRRVVERMLHVARPSADERGMVDLAEVVREVAAFLSIEARRKGVELRLLLDRAAPRVEAVRDQLLEVVMNLAVNAIRAQPEGGSLRITLSTIRHGEDDAPVNALCLEVADAGPGIPEADRALVFEPFYSTRRASGGTGLGLSIVADVVRNLGGKVSVGAAPEGGALFQVSLPLVEVAPS